MCTFHRLVCRTVYSLTTLNCLVQELGIIVPILVFTVDSFIFILTFLFFQMNMYHILETVTVNDTLLRIH